MKSRKITFSRYVQLSGGSSTELSRLLQNLHIYLLYVSISHLYSESVVNSYSPLLKIFRIEFLYFYLFIHIIKVI
jgi:hypothetical protein